MVGLNGEERANLVSETFKRINETGAQAVSFTCDGPVCHLTMMKKLGANVDITQFNSSIPNPADPAK